MHLPSRLGKSLAGLVQFPRALAGPQSPRAMWFQPWCNPPFPLARTCLSEPSHSIHYCRSLGKPHTSTCLGNNLGMQVSALHRQQPWLNAVRLPGCQVPPKSYQDDGGAHSQVVHLQLFIGCVPHGHTIYQEHTSISWLTKWLPISYFQIQWMGVAATVAVTTIALARGRYSPGARKTTLAWNFRVS